MPATTTSDVWKHFTRSEDKKTVKCNICSSELTWCGGTTNLRNHLRKHPQAISTASPATKKQASMTSFVATPKKTTSAADAERITQAIADMVVSDYVPLSIVEGEGFRQLLELLAPEYKIPARNTIRSRILRRFEEERTALVSKLSEVKSASITTDTWTSNSTESYLTVTEHHIDDDWRLRSNVLLTRPMPERHTGENLAARLKDCVEEFNLGGKIETCVHDNARNMERAGSICEEWSDLGCFGHTLQLCVKPALELPAAEKVISRCRKLIGHFKHSTTVTAELEKRQVLLDAPRHCLIQDVATRWNSTQAMMERLTEQRRVITDIMLDPKITKKGDTYLLLKDHEWDVIADMSNVLRVFADVTSYMCTEKDISVSEILPIVCGLQTSCLRSEESDSSLVLKMKETIRRELDSRYRPSSLEAARSTTALASLVDPRYKRLPFFSSQQRRVAEEVLESRLDDLPLKTSSHDDVCESPVPTKRRRLEFTVFMSTDRSADDQMRSYLAEPMDADAQPLEWWKENERRFPTVAVIARKLLAVPATSVPSERIFSTAGLLLSKLRNRLTGDLVDSIIFLSRNRVVVSESVYV